jgi:prepilin peptidase CpaA
MCCGRPLLQPSDLVVVGTLVAGAGAGAVIDLRTRRVPNVVTGTLAVTGILLAVSGASGVTVLSSFAGLALGLAIMMPGHVIGATGAGDVKLFAAAGAVIGAGRILPAFLYTALAGGLIAILVALLRRRLRHTLATTATLVVTRAANVAEIESPRANNRFAYAPAIAIGVVLAALGL